MHQVDEAMDGWMDGLKCTSVVTRALPKQKQQQHLQL